MATRGYVGFLDTNMRMSFFYNHNDSYPSCLLKEILERLSEGMYYLDDEEYSFSVFQDNFYELIEKAKKGELIRFKK